MGTGPGSTKMQQENRVVSGLVDHRYRSVTKLRHRGTPVDRPPTCRPMVRSRTPQTTAKLKPLDLPPAPRLCRAPTTNSDLRPSAAALLRCCMDEDSGLRRGDYVSLEWGGGGGFGGGGGGLRAFEPHFQTPPFQGSNVMQPKRVW